MRFQGLMVLAISTFAGIVYTAATPQAGNLAPITTGHSVNRGIKSGLDAKPPAEAHPFTAPDPFITKRAELRNPNGLTFNIGGKAYVVAGAVAQYYNQGGLSPYATDVINAISTWASGTSVWTLDAGQQQVAYWACTLDGGGIPHSEAAASALQSAASQAYQWFTWTTGPISGLVFDLNEQATGNQVAGFYIGSDN